MGQADVPAWSNIELQVTLLFTRCMFEFYLHVIQNKNILTRFLERGINDQGVCLFYIWYGF